MMKKFLSIFLTVCMLLTLVIVPVNATEASAQAEGKTHAYYKWDFSEDKLYTDYDNPVKPEGVTYDFKAVNNSGNHSFAYATLNGEDALRIRASKSNNNIMFTPLKEDGTPFQLEAGKQYSVSITYYISRLGAAWSRPHFEIYTTVDGSCPRSSLSRTVGEGESATTEYLFFDPATNKVMNGYSSLYANKEIGYFDNGRNLKNATYYDSYEMTEVDGVKTFTMRDSNYGDVAVAVPGQESKYSYTTDVILATDEVLANEWNVTKNADGSYRSKGKDYTNFFGFSLPPAYGSYWIEGYDENAFENVQDGEGNWFHRAYAEYYVTELTIAEKGVGSVNYHVGDTVTTVVGNAGDAVDLTPPAVPAGKDYFVNWYTDAEFTQPIGTAQTLKEGAPLELYAKYAEYGSYVKNDYENGQLPSTAVQYTAEGGFYYPLHGFSHKGNSYDSQMNKGELKAHLAREGISTEFPASTIAFYSDRTWGMPGGVNAYNADGTLFIPEAGKQYKITYRYMAPVHNGKNMAINVVYGIPDTFMNKTTTGDSTGYYTAYAWNTITEPVTEWTTVTEIITIPKDNNTSVPAIGLWITGIAKVAVDLDGDGVTDGANDGFNYSAVLLDYLEIEKLPSATVNFLNADGSVHTAAKEVAVGDAISYPTLTAALNYDYVWSLSATSYVPAPKTIENEEALTVYAYQNPVLSYENRPIHIGNNVQLYSGNIDYDNEMGAVTSDKDAYTGDKSLKLRNYGMQWVATEANYNTAVSSGAYKYDATTDSFVLLDEVPEFVAATEETIANGTAIAIKRISEETGMNIIELFPKCESISISYKISFKYKATEKNTTESSFTARLFPKGNIWWGSQKINGTFTFPAGATDGWQTGEMYVSVDNFTNVPGKSFTTSSYEFVLDLKFNGHSTLLSTNEIYVDDIVIEKNYVNTPTLYVHTGDTVTEVTEGLTAGGAVDLAALDAKVPAGKYFINWADANGNAITSLTMPAATVFCKAHIYANYGTYPDGVTIDTTGASQPALKGYSAYTSSTLNEGGWARKTYTAAGVHFQKAFGGANRWDPAKTDGFNQTTEAVPFVADKENLEVGKQKLAGWGALVNYVLRDKDGNAIMAKPNTKYAVSVTYEKTGEGTQHLSVLAGRKADYVTKGADAYGATTYGNFASSKIAYSGMELNGENDTYTYYVTTGTFAAGDVPVFSLHYEASTFVVERVAEINGVESYVVNGATYYPYKIVSTPGLLIKDVQIIEVDSGNAAVTFKTYEKGVGFSAVLKDNLPGTAIDEDTKNFDTKWYKDIVAWGGSIVTTYPSSDAIYYSAAHAQVNSHGKYVFGDGWKNGATEKTFTFESDEIDGVNALHVAATEEIGGGDAESFILAHGVKDNHTYKISYKYKAVAANSLFGFNAYVHQSDNLWSRAANGDRGNFIVKNAVEGEWTEVTVYFTMDFIGTNASESETGLNYNISNDYRNTLSFAYCQVATAEGNDIYFKDFVVTDLGEVISAGGASVLTDAAAQVAGNQAMRYYFSYNTVDGSTIALGEDTLKVVERGFLYRNGYVESGKAETVFYVGTAGTVKQSKTSDFNICWNFDQATGNMTFSTYVTGFKMNDDARKLEVKAYIIAEDEAGNRFIIYADSINRTVAGVKGVGGASDTDVEAGQ